MATTTKPHMGSINEALAPELIDMICENLESGDFLSFRLVCLDMHGKSYDAFLNRFFTHRRQLITEYSLQNFLAITKQKRLLSKLKSVEFVIVQLRKNRKYWWLDEAGAFKILDAATEAQKEDSSTFEEVYGQTEGRDKSSDSDSEDDSNAEDREGDSEDDSEADSGDDHSEDRDEKATDEGNSGGNGIARIMQKPIDAAKTIVYARWELQLNALGNLVELHHITSALKNLKNNGICPALLISSGVWHSFTRAELAVEPAYGIRRLHRDLGLDPEDYHPLRNIGWRSLFVEDIGYCQDASRLLLTSIAKADFPIRDLAASSYLLRSSIGDLDLGSLNPRLHLSLYGLRRLSLSLWYRILEEDLDTFTSFLAAATSLEDLALEFDCNVQMEGYSIPGNFSSSLILHQLTSLELSYACFEREDLERLLYFHMRSLRRLKFESISLKANEDWEPMLQNMAEKLDLVSMSLDIGDGWNQVGPVMGKGSEEVEKGFAELTRLYREREWDD